MRNKWIVGLGAVITVVALLEPSPFGEMIGLSLMYFGATGKHYEG